MKVFYRYRRFLILLLAEVVLFSVLVLYCHYRAVQMEGYLKDTASLSGSLGLTDLSLWTSARYARAPVLADRFNPFQDFPGSIEHFPAGSILSPPEHLRQ